MSLPSPTPLMTYMKDAIVYAAVVAGYAFFMFLSAITVAQIRSDTTATLIGGAVVLGGTFFAVLTGRMLPGPPKVSQ